MQKDKEKNNIAYIDAANLHNGIGSLGWKLDYARFRVWLSEKYSAKAAYLFIGLVPKYKDLYTHLQEAGFTLIFKETIYDGDGNIKGNCDADLVLQVTRDYYENKFNRAIIVASDGDYSSLVKFLREKGKMWAILSPANTRKCSILLKRTEAPIIYLNDKRSILEKRGP
ncbi:MAG: NYN domain-containing protein [Candidatus Pacebacteria bacterium]|nr:NYN domain-containing protein [Candidatus Paceibacterota bacterium]